MVWCLVKAQGQLYILYNLYSSPSIVKRVKSRNVRWAGHIARMGEMRIEYKILVGKLGGRDQSEDLGVVARVTLEWILWK
jgi:hypothetical protein